MRTSFWLYWGRVIVQAAIDAKKCGDYVGLGPIKMTATFVIVLVVCAVAGAFLGQNVSERILWAIGGLIAGFGLLAFIFVVFLVKVPPRLDAEHCGVLAARDKTISELTAQINRTPPDPTLQAKIDRIGELLDKAAAIDSWFRSPNGSEAQRRAYSEIFAWDQEVTDYLLNKLPLHVTTYEGPLQLVLK